MKMNANTGREKARQQQSRLVPEARRGYHTPLNRSYESSWRGKGDDKTNKNKKGTALNEQHCRDQTTAATWYMQSTTVTCCGISNDIYGME